MEQPGSLKQFVKDEMELRGMKSAREFARFVDVAHVTINRILDERNEQPYEPTLDILIRIARATGKDISSIIYMLYPDLKSNVVSPSANLLAQQIEQLPEDEQRIIRQFMFGRTAER